MVRSIILNQVVDLSRWMVNADGCKLVRQHCKRICHLLMSCYVLLSLFSFFLLFLSHEYRKILFVTPINWKWYWIPSKMLNIQYMLNKYLFPNFSWLHFLHQKLLLLNNCSLPGTYRSQYYGTDFWEKKGALFAGKKTGGKAQTCVLDPRFRMGF